MHENDNISEEYSLQAKHVCKKFGGVTALDDAQLNCRRGETHVLIGENGAGKSTIIKIICGVVKPDNAEIYINGQPVSIRKEKDAELNKISSVFQELSLIQDLSVAENIFLGHEITGRYGNINFKKMYKEAEDFLKELGLNLNPRMLVRDLNLCDKQLVEIAKALFKDPDILILDEATSALGENEVKWLFKKIIELTYEKNKTIIFISHRMDELEKVADWATIFRDARFIKSFKWGTLSKDEIITQISGKKTTENKLERNKPLSDEIVLEVKNGFLDNKLYNINFKLKKGEILGVAGLSGHGQIELLHALYGDKPMEACSIFVNGKKTVIRNERNALKAGIFLVPEDRKNEGLMLERPISENLTIVALETMQKFGIIDKAVERSYIQKAIDMLSIKTKDVRLNVSSLSGGNQQKVVIGKSLLSDVKVLLLSDPTRGIDVGTKNEIYKLMSKLASDGMSILFFSTEITELVSLCSRVMIFYEGRIFTELQNEEITEDNIIAASIGVKYGGIKNAEQ